MKSATAGLRGKFTRADEMHSWSEAALFTLSFNICETLFKSSVICENTQFR